MIYELRIYRCVPGGATLKSEKVQATPMPTCRPSPAGR